ncbi:ThuA domain-containing protein [Rhodocytophaga rosea]|nr:ThuA domain-containing protein [Rhodocytophaga rosea]
MAQTDQASTPFKVLALAENGGHHIRYSQAAKIWLTQLATQHHFSVDYIENTDKISETFLSQYQLFIQLDYVPYGWKPVASAAFEKYITSGKGGWIGFHHATLMGEFDGYPMWQWFSAFMGGIRYVNYIPSFVSGEVIVEQVEHPVMKGVPSTFTVKTEEWYIYDKSPRPKVQVLARVDEASYQPDSKIKMGDHPVVWINPEMKARNIYIFMGHSPDLFENEAYKQLVQNAILWAAGRQ